MVRNRARPANLLVGLFIGVEELITPQASAAGACYTYSRTFQTTVKWVVLPRAHASSLQGVKTTRLSIRTVTVGSTNAQNHHGFASGLQKRDVVAIIQG